MASENGQPAVFPASGAPDNSSRLRRWLINPSVRVTQSAERRQARLLAVFLLVLLLLTAVGSIAPAAMKMSNPLDDPFTLMMSGTTVAILAAYLLSRSRWYQSGAYLAALVLSALPFALALTRQDFDPQRIPGIFGWLILGLLLGSIFLNWKGVLFLAAANSVALAVFPRIVPQVDFRMVFPPLSVQLVAGALVLVAIYQRNQLERDRRADLEAKNLELEGLQRNLEANVEDRTQDLARRLVQIRTAADISRSISATLAPEELLQQVVELVQERFQLYYVGVFLVDEDHRFAILQAGSGQAGADMVAEGHRLAVGGASMVGWATAHGKARISQEVGTEAVHFNNPHLPETRSELALPLISTGQVIGALTVQSTQPAAFDQDDISILQSFADSLATAINNANLFTQLQESLEEIQNLHRNYLSHAWSRHTLPASELSAIFEMQNPAPAEQAATSLPINIPVSLREQEIGQLTLEADKSDWSPEEIAFIEAVTTQAAVALENARLLEETQRRAERERVVSEISSRIWATTDMEALLRTTIKELGRALNVTEGVIQLDLDGRAASQPALDG